MQASHIVSIVETKALSGILDERGVQFRGPNPAIHDINTADLSTPPLEAGATVMSTTPRLG